MAHSANHQKHDGLPVLEEIRQHRRFFYRIWGPAILVSVIAFGIAWLFVKPAPPSHLVIAAGPQGGAYFAFATEMAQVFAENRIHLEVLETAGSVENYELLQADDTVHLAMVQGGTGPDSLKFTDLQSIASLYLEPLWIFSRRDNAPQTLRDLSKLRVTIGQNGSGTANMMRKLLKVNNLSLNTDSGTNEPGPTYIRIGGLEAVEKLESGEVDAACFVSAASSPLIERLIDNPDLKLMPFERAKAYSHYFPFLSDITISEGVIDIVKNAPETDVELIAASANLVCTPDLHDAFVPLIIKAASKSLHGKTLLTDSGRFPSLEFSEFSPHASAMDYYRSGPSFLNRYLPFWIASLLSRGKILLLPLFTLIFPVFKIAPPLYRWRIRSRIYRWYVLLREIDQQTDSLHPKDYPDVIAKLQTVEDELKDVSIPLSYMQEFYNLRMHVDLIKRRLRDELREEMTV